MKYYYFSLLFILSSCTSKYIGPDRKVLDYFENKQDDLLLVVKVKNTVWTGLYQKSKECEKDNNCIPWRHWYVYEAEILDILNGQFTRKHIKFALLSHADYLKEIKQEWYVQLGPFENIETSNKLDALYYIENHSSKYFLNN